MIKKNVYFNDWENEFRDYNRFDSFSYKGHEALFNYLEELSEDIGEDIELDVIGICCDFTEYESIEEYNMDYGNDLESIEELWDYTTVINIDDTSFIIQDY